MVCIGEIYGPGALIRRKYSRSGKIRKPAVRRFVRAEVRFGEHLGLDARWALNAVRAAGNYGEIFERNAGTGSKLGIPRGINQMWNTGGILYAPPIR